MTSFNKQFIVLVFAAILSPACAPASTSTPLSSTEPASTDTPAPPTVVPSTPPASSGTPDGGTDEVVGIVVRFTAGSTSVEVTIDQDNPAVRDVLSMLPLTLTLEEFAGREKIGYLPRELAHAGSPGSDPEDGHLIYYVPWGNIGFYYNTAGISYSDRRSISEPTTRRSICSNNWRTGTSSSRSSADADRNIL